MPLLLPFWSTATGGELVTTQLSRCKPVVSLSLLVAENAVTFLPALANPAQAPGVTVRPLDEPAAHWDLHVAWQRGKMAEPVRALLEKLQQPVARGQ